MEKLDAVVIGAGIIGLAIGRAIALAGREVYVLEQNPSFGQETSSRNSEVIHAGIYYPEGSIKALCCVEGRKLLYRYCRERHIPHQQSGKLIVATTRREADQLPFWIERAKCNGVDDLQLLTPGEVAELEPETSTCGAILSPSSGIIDSHSLMLNFAGDIENAGGKIVYNCQVTGGSLQKRLLSFRTSDNPKRDTVCHYLINAAGLAAPQLSQTLGLDNHHIPTPYYAKGHYYTLSGCSPFQRLVYPLPGHAGLGIHATLDLDGRTRFGPDVTWIERPDYHFDTNTKGSFIEAIRRYYPALDETRLIPGYTGIRTKIAPPGEGDVDFVIQTPADHGIPGLCNLFGIESPGLTASMAIADRVVQTLGIAHAN